MDCTWLCCDEVFSSKTAMITLSILAGVAALVTIAALSVLFIPALSALLSLSTLTVSKILGVSAVIAIIAGVGAVLLGCAKTSKVHSSLKKETSSAPHTPRRPSFSKKVAFVPTCQEEQSVATLTPKKAPSDRFSLVILNQHQYYLLSPKQFEYWTRAANTEALKITIERHQINQLITIGDTQLSVLTPQHQIDLPTIQYLLPGAVIAADCIKEKRNVMIAAKNYVEYARFLLYVEGVLKVRESIMTPATLKEALIKDLITIDARLEEKTDDYAKNVILSDENIQAMLAIK